MGAIRRCVHMHVGYCVTMIPSQRSYGYLAMVRLVFWMSPGLDSEKSPLGLGTCKRCLGIFLRYCIHPKTRNPKPRPSKGLNPLNPKLPFNPDGIDDFMPTDSVPMYSGTRQFTGVSKNSGNSCRSLEGLGFTTRGGGGSLVSPYIP